LRGGARQFVLLLYLEQAIAATRNDGLALTSDMLVEGIREDAVLRVWPKAMTVAVIVARRLR
jgi:Cu/Ag efflux pump CusA